MKTSVWSHLISENTTRAVCWTLIHSLWIGLVIALLCGIVIATTRKSTAVLRYRILCGLLVLFVFSLGITYRIELRLNATEPLPPVPPITVVIGPDASVSQQLGTVLNKSTVDDVTGFLNQNATIIFLVWLVLFLFKSLKMAGGLLHIQRIRNYKTETVSEELKNRVAHFSEQIGIKRAVRLEQSGLIKVPVAVGWLKPMILLPAGILFQFSAEQIDGILWHELAHIRRSDYLVNILQGIVETVFFFNPGLLWLSALIRAEREACCDDIVLSHMNKKANYLEALLAFGYGEFKTSGWAMGIGSGNQLGDRLKRMINRENKRLGVIEKVFLIAGIVVLSGFAGLRSVNKKYMTQLNYATQLNTAVERALTGEPLVKPDLHEAHTGYDKIDSLVSLISTSYKKGDYPPVTVTDIKAEDILGKTYHLTLVENKLVGLELNGKKIQTSDLPEYQYMATMFQDKGKAGGVVLAKRLNAGESALPVLLSVADTSIHFNNLHFSGNPADKANFTASAEDAAHNKYKLTVNGNRLTALNINGNDIQKNDLPRYAGLLRHIPAPPPPPPAPPGVSGNKADTLNIGYFSVHSNRAGGDTTIVYNAKADDSHGKNYHFVATYDRVMSMSINGIELKESELPKYEYVVRAVLKKQWAMQKAAISSIQQQRDILQPKEPQKPTAPPSLDKMISGIMSDLINENILRDKNNLSTFKLTNTELVVNGTRQPDDIQRKLKAKYLKNPVYVGDRTNNDSANFGLYYNAKSHGVALGSFDLDLDAL